MPVLRVYPCEKHLIARLGHFRIKAENSKVLERPEELVGGRIPGPASGVADPLALRQIGLAALEFLLDASALRAISRQRAVTKQRPIVIAHRSNPDSRPKF